MLAEAEAGKEWPHYESKNDSRPVSARGPSAPDVSSSLVKCGRARGDCKA